MELVSIISSSIQDFANTNQLLFHLMIVAASLALLIKASDFALYGIIEYAKKLGISDYLVGLVIIALGASLPELISSIMGTVADDPGVVLGTILGSNITGITLVLGITAVFAKKLKLDPKVLERTEAITLFTVILPFVLMLDGMLSRIDALILIISCLVYFVMIWKKEGEIGKLKKDVRIEKIYQHGIVFVIALAAILLSARWLVFSSIKVASLLNVSSYMISLIVIGIGTSMPDLMVSIRSIIKGHKGIGIGNSLGSIVIKSLLFLGVMAMINPIAVVPSMIFGAEIVLILSLGFILYLTARKNINWRHGIALIMMYILFIAIELMRIR